MMVVKPDKQESEMNSVRLLAHRAIRLKIKKKVFLQVQLLFSLVKRGKTRNFESTDLDIKYMSRSLSFAVII